MVREANQLLATSTSLERKYHALPHYATERVSTSLEEDAHVRHPPARVLVSHRKIRETHSVLCGQKCINIPFGLNNSLGHDCEVFENIM